MNILRGLKESGIEFHENKNMSEYSPIRTGGVARLIIFPKNEPEIVSVLSILNMRNAESCGYYVIGGGTNTLFRDEKISLPVISFKKFNADIFENKQNGIETIIEAGAGMPLPAILGYSIKRNIGGCEFFYGIPGTVGGAVRMNAGSKESAIGNIIERIDIIKEDGVKSAVYRNGMEFSYRNLDIKGVSGNYFITKVYLKVYKSTESDIAENILIFKKRKLLQPLSESSLGCIFKNPLGFSAGKIIEEIGFKGRSKGGASVSEKHANFIVNRGGAKPDDIMYLIKKIQEKAFLDKGVKLTTEIKII